MDLSDALSWPGGNQSGGNAWPGQPPSDQPQWPGQPNQPGWPNQPNQPGWPNQPNQPNPSPWPNQPSTPGFPSPVPSGPLTVPYTQTLPNGVFNKLLITIRGTIKPHPDKITVDLSAGQDIAFHFNPRFNEAGKTVIVRNTRIRNQWGKEERELSRFPFSPGQPFEMKIMCTSSEFKVAVNQSHLLEFRHRIQNLRSITGLGIYNDLTLSSVQVQTMP